MLPRVAFTPGRSKLQNGPVAGSHACRTASGYWFVSRIRHEEQRQGGSAHFMKKALESHGSLGRSLLTVCAVTARRSTSSAVSRSKRWDAGRTIGLRTATWRSSDESERCSGSGR